MSTQLVLNQEHDLMEKVIIEHDLSKFTPNEKVNYIVKLCNSLGLNSLTKPVQLMKFQGKEILYFTKDASEQLRNINHVSITKLDTEILNNRIYIVKAHAQLPNGRLDESTGVISIENLKGDALANAMMKAETKAKRRVTLSICGIGFTDESELDTMPRHQKIDIDLKTGEIHYPKELEAPAKKISDELPEDYIPSTETIDIEQNIKNCNDEINLKIIGNNIKESDTLSDYDRIFLREKYKTKLGEIVHGTQIAN